MKMMDCRSNMSEFKVSRSVPEYDIICSEWHARITVKHSRKTCTIFISADSEASCTEKLCRTTDQQAITEAKIRGLGRSYKVKEKNQTKLL